jgi:hypothetical protein
MEAGHPLVREVFPELATELVALLEEEGEQELAICARDVRLVADCGCGARACGATLHNVHYRRSNRQAMPHPTPRPRIRHRSQHRQNVPGPRPDQPRQRTGGRTQGQPAMMTRRAWSREVIRQV